MIVSTNDQVEWSWWGKRNKFHKKKNTFFWPHKTMERTFTAVKFYDHLIRCCKIRLLWILPTSSNHVEQERKKESKKQNKITFQKQKYALCVSFRFVSSSFISLSELFLWCILNFLAIRYTVWQPLFVCVCVCVLCWAAVESYISVSQNHRKAAKKKNKKEKKRKEKVKVFLLD